MNRNIGLQFENRISRIEQLRKYQGEGTGNTRVESCKSEGEKKTVKIDSLARRVLQEHWLLFRRLLRNF